MREAFTQPSAKPPLFSKPGVRADGRPADYEAPGKPRRTFYLEPFDQIDFTADDEYLIKNVIPLQGVGILCGKSQSFKSFVALDIAFNVAAGNDWANIKTVHGPAIYIAAEGARGVRKRKNGWQKQNPRAPRTMPFYLVSAAPNLGSSTTDLADLIASIEAAGVKPALITIDTLAQTIGEGEENGSGMIQYLANALALSQRFGCFVLIVHHVGLGNDQRGRGHSSLDGAVDLQLLCEREQGAMATAMTLQKLKDEASQRAFTVSVVRVVTDHDMDGDEVSTLVVESVTETNAPKVVKPKKRDIPPNMRLLTDVIVFVTNSQGFEFKPYTNGPAVRAATDHTIRAEYYRRIAEKAEPGEDQAKLLDRQKKAFNRSISGALEKRLIGAGIQNDERVIWTL